VVKFDWIIADEFYGHNGDFLDELEQMQQRYVVEVPVNTTVWTVDPQTQVPPHRGRGPRPTRPKRNRVRSVRAIAADLPPSAWQVLQLRPGAKGPLAFAFAGVRVWAVRHRKPGVACWLVLRRSLEPDAEVKYYLSNAAADESLETMALVTGTRYRVEEFFEEGKGYLGMAQYEARAWASWHHHMSLVALAHLFVTMTRLRLQSTLPELSLDMALRLVTSALPRPQLTEADAIAIVEYHLQRNRTARTAHVKAWHQRHNEVAYKVLL
jgi:SRSO17 transposase